MSSDQPETRIASGAHVRKQIGTKIGTVYRGPSIDASYQVLAHLAKLFQRRRLKCDKLKDDGRQVMAKAHVAFGKVS